MVLLALITFLSFSLATRSDIETTILKVPGQLYQKTDVGNITNLYNLQFVNKTFDDMTLKVRVENESSAKIFKVGGGDVTVSANGLAEGVYFIEMPAEKIDAPKINLKVGVYNGGELVETVKTKFLGPVSLVK